MLIDREGETQESWAVIRDASLVVDQTAARSVALDALGAPRVRALMAGCALAIAGITLLAWIMRLERPMHFGGALALMPFNTALMVGLLAGAALTSATRQLGWARLQVALAGVIAGATFLEVPLLPTSSIDFFFPRNWTAAEAARARPNPSASIAGLLLAGALLVGSQRINNVPAWGIAAACAASILALVAFLSTAGHFPVPGINMAVSGALSLALLAITALGGLWRKDSRPVLARQLDWHPVIAGSGIFVAVVLGWVLLTATMSSPRSANPSMAVAILLLAGLLSTATFLAVRHSTKRRITAVQFAERVVAEAQAAIRAGAALRESEERFRATFENAAVGIAHVAPDGRWLRVNDRLCAMVGYTCEELLTKTFQDLTHPDDLDADLALMHRLLAGEIANYSTEKRYVCKGGEIVSINLTVSLVRKLNGAPDYFISVIEDVSQRKRAEEERRQSEAIRSARLAAALDAIITIDHRGMVTEWNRAAEQMFGYAEANALGREMAELIIPARLREAHRRGMAVYLASGEGPIIGRLIELTAVRENGEEFPIELYVVPVPVEGAPMFTGFARDITQRKRAEEELVEGRAHLARAQKMEAVGQLTGGMAHDFNNLLTVILGNLELYETRHTHGVAQELLHEARDAAEMGARLTERLLTFSRTRPLEPEVVDLSDQVLAMSELLRRSLGEAIDFSAKLASDLWPVRVNSSEMENAILNLAINARDAMPQGGKLIIETRNVQLDDGSPAQLQPGDYVLLSISDSGAGMPPEVLQRAFEPFFTTKDPGKGTGLGLASVYGFVKQTGGHAEIYSELGRGTSVHVYLPRLDDEAQPRRESDVDAPFPAATGETILVVEDNLLVRRLTLRRLQALGFKVIEADSGPAALKALEAAETIHLVFTDIVMCGGMSGLDLAQWIGERRPSLKVVLTSGFAEEIARDRGGLDRELSILRKPYSQAELMRVLRDALYKPD